MNQQPNTTFRRRSFVNTWLLLAVLLGLPVGEALCGEALPTRYEGTMKIALEIAPVDSPSRTGSFVSSRFSSSELQVWDVTKDSSRGAIANGGDITAALQEGFRQQKKYKLPIYIPPGWWVLSETVTTPHRTGWHLIGGGVGSPLGVTAASDESNQFNGKVARLVWKGADGEPMIRVRGSHGRLDGGLVLHGKPWKSKQKGQAGYGMLMTRTAKGLGDGKHVFDKLMFVNCDVGIQHGASALEGNNDQTRYKHVYFHNCGKGFVNYNSQSISIHFGFVHTWKTPYTFWIEAGGPLIVDHSTNFDNTLISIGKHEDGGTGSSIFATGLYVFNDTRVDPSVARGDNFVAVETRDAMAGLHFVFNHLSFGNMKRTNAVFARLKGGSHLTVRDSTGPFGRVIGTKAAVWGKDRTPNVLFDRCNFTYSGFKPIFEGNVNYKVRDCFDLSGKMINGSSE